MEEKTARELVKQLTRIADALERSTNLQTTQEKRKVLLDRLEEKNLRATLRGAISGEPDIQLNS
jgi:predicted methyltransferase MtxX (methanogen marker protein 4)